MLTAQVKSLVKPRSVAGLVLIILSGVLLLLLEPLLIQLSGVRFFSESTWVTTGFSLCAVLALAGLFLVVYPLRKMAFYYIGAAILVLAFNLYNQQNHRLEQDMTLLRYYAPGLKTFDASAIQSLPVALEREETTFLFFLSENDCSTCMSEIKKWNTRMLQTGNRKDMIFFVNAPTKKDATEAIASLDLQVPHTVIFDDKMRYARGMGIEQTPVLLIIENDRLLFRHKIGGVYPQFERFVKG